MIDSKKYSKIIKKIENFKNRLERRIISKSITPEEEETVNDVVFCMDKLSYGKEPLIKTHKTTDDEYYKNTENLEGKIFKKMDELGVIYFLLTASKEPLVLLNIFRKIEESLKGLEIISKESFVFLGKEHKIIKDESIVVSGIFEKDSVLYNPLRIKKGKIASVIKHEIIHFILHQTGASAYMSNCVCIKNVEELIADFISINTDIVKTKDGVSFEN